MDAQGMSPMKAARVKLKTELRCNLHGLNMLLSVGCSGAGMNLSCLKIRLKCPHVFNWEGGVGARSSVQQLRLVSGSICSREGSRSFIPDEGLHPTSHSLQQSCGSLLR